MNPAGDFLVLILLIALFVGGWTAPYVIATCAIVWKTPKVITNIVRILYRQGRIWYRRGLRQTKP